MSTAVPPANTVFDSTRPLLYDVEPWAGLGFGVPNFGRNVGTLSLPIWRLVNEIGMAQLFVMTTDDAPRDNYLSPNTVSAIAKNVNLIYAVLNGRQKLPNDWRISAGHASASPRVWLLHPVPFFQSALVQNGFLMEFNELCMVALTNMLRHSDNNLPLTITSDFAQDCWQYFREIKIRACTELLGMTIAAASDDSQPMPTGPYAGPGTQNMMPGGAAGGTAAAAQPTYNPPATTVNMERLRTAGALFSRPSQDDLQPFKMGIPATLIIPNLAQYPVGPLPGEDALSGENTPGLAALVGVGAVAGPGGSMGSPLGLTPAAQAVMNAVAANVGTAPGTTDGLAPGTPSASAGTASAGIAQPST